MEGRRQDSFPWIWAKSRLPSRAIGTPGIPPRHPPILKDTGLDTADFEQVQILKDPEAGLLGFIAIHNTRLGPAFGGIRRWAYATVDEALRDALLLATHMTLKCALHRIPAGGGKAVICQRPGLDRAAAYRRLGQYVEQMRGRFYTGPDVGTEAADLLEVGSQTRFVALPGENGPGDLAEPTAVGVFAGIRTMSQRLGFSDLQGVSVLVQGLGAVGRRLADKLARVGARLLVADVLPDRVQDAVREWGAQAVEVDRVASVPCDVFAPCALGGAINPGNVSHLGAKAVAGSANNVLSTPECGAQLHRQGVLYAPDFVINSGALLHGALFHLEGVTPPRERIEGIGDLLASVLETSADQDLPPEVVAEHLARERVAASDSDIYLPPAP